MPAQDSLGMLAGLGGAAANPYGAAFSALESLAAPAESGNSGGDVGAGISSSPFVNNASILMGGSRQDVKSSLTASASTPEAQIASMNGATDTSLPKWILPTAIGLISIVSVIILVKVLKK